MWLDKFNEMRKTSGMSLDEISAKSGVPKGTLSKITSGITKAPPLETMRKLVYSMGYTLNDLDDNPPKSKNSPSADKSAPGENIISVEESNRLLSALGLIEEGQQLSDDDLAFLTHIIGLLDTWFGNGH